MRPAPRVAISRRRGFFYGRPRRERMLPLCVLVARYL